MILGPQYKFEYHETELKQIDTIEQIFYINHLFYYYCLRFITYDQMNVFLSYAFGIIEFEYNFHHRILQFSVEIWYYLSSLK